MSRRIQASLLSALLVAGLPATLVAQETSSEAAPVWAASAKPGASDVAPLGDGFVLVGGRDKPTVGKVWTSPDGRTWTRPPDDGLLKGTFLRLATAFGDGVVALGTQGRKLVSLYSPDGIDWQRTTIDRVGKEMELFPTAVTDGPAGLIAVASMIAQDFAGQRFYRSVDGRSWEQIDAPTDPVTGMFVSLLSTDDEYYAVARPMFTPAADLYWRSPDGVSWEAFDGPVDGNIHDLAVDDGTYVAVGQDTESFASAIWRADELGTWERVYTSASTKETEERLDLVALGGPGFIAGGSTSTCPEQAMRYCPELSLLTSEDGREWRSLGVDDGVPGPLHDTLPLAISTNGDTTAMVMWHEGRVMEAWTLPPTP